MKKISQSQLILVEGPDRTGKSTFISELADQLEKQGKEVFIFHGTGVSIPNYSLKISKLQQGLSQLVKYSHDYEIIKKILDNQANRVVILDRTHFGEYVWMQFFNRQNKYSRYICTKKFVDDHFTGELLNSSTYINFTLSDKKRLKQMIEESPEDKHLYTEYKNRSIDSNLNYVFNKFKRLKNLVIKYGFDVIDIDSSLYELDSLSDFIKNLLQ